MKTSFLSDNKPRSHMNLQGKSECHVLSPRPSSICSKKLDIGIKRAEETRLPRRHFLVPSYDRYKKSKKRSVFHREMSINTLKASPHLVAWHCADDFSIPHSCTQESGCKERSFDSTKKITRGNHILLQSLSIESPISTKRQEITLSPRRFENECSSFSPYQTTPPSSAKLKNSPSHLKFHLTPRSQQPFNLNTPTSTPRQVPITVLSGEKLRNSTQKHEVIESHKKGKIAKSDDSYPGHPPLMINAVPMDDEKSGKLYLSDSNAIDDDRRVCSSPSYLAARRKDPNSGPNSVPSLYLEEKMRMDQVCPDNEYNNESLSSQKKPLRMFRLSPSKNKRAGFQMTTKIDGDRKSGVLFTPPNNDKPRASSQKLFHEPRIVSAEKKGNYLKKPHLEDVFSRSCHSNIQNMECMQDSVVAKLSSGFEKCSESRSTSPFNFANPVYDTTEQVNFSYQMQGKKAKGFEGGIHLRQRKFAESRAPLAFGSAPNLLQSRLYIGSNKKSGLEGNPSFLSSGDHVSFDGKGFSISADDEEASQAISDLSEDDTDEFFLSLPSFNKEDPVTTRKKTRIISRCSE